MNLLLAFLTTLPWWRWPLAVIALLFCAWVWFRPDFLITGTVKGFRQRRVVSEKNREDESGQR